MKKAMTLVLSIVMILALAACGGNATTPAAGGSSNTTTTAPANSGSAAAPAASADPYETASGWPHKDNITLIVPAGAGGTLDLTCRLVVAELEKELGATVVVENVPGGGMWIGLKQALAAPKDGYTFVVYNSPLVAIANYNDANPQEENPSDYAKLCNDVVDYGALAIRVDDPRFSDLDSFVAYAKEHEVVCTAGARGLANGDASSAEWFNINCGTNITVMTVDSSADGMARFYAGDTDCFFGSIGDLLGDKDAGIYKIIGTFSEDRSELTPDVPSLQEQGYDYANFVARGFAYPAGVDQEIVDKMTIALSKACEAASDKVLELGMETKVMTGTEYETMEQEMLESRLAIYGLTLADKVVG